MIEGIPIITLMTNFTELPNLVSLPNSERYTPAKSPIGTLINPARATIAKLPTMALATPPPGTPGGVGNLVKKLRL